MKLTSQSWKATAFCYLLLVVLAGIAVKEDRNVGYHAAVTPTVPGQAKKLW
jgi:hypothetical protein